MKIMGNILLKMIESYRLLHLSHRNASGIKFLIKSFPKMLFFFIEDSRMSEVGICKKCQLVYYGLIFTCEYEDL